MELMDTDEYMRRIGVEYYRDRLPDLPFLTEIQSSHLLNVPWENLDLFQGKKISCDVVQAYEKVVEKHRGGWCFELNGLLCWALNNMKYEAYLANSQPAIPTDPIQWQRDMAHTVVIVTTNNKQMYMCDVAYRPKFTAMKPIPLVEGVVTECSNGKYRLIKDGSWWQLQFNIKDDIWATGHRFCTEKKYDLRDFEAVSEVIQSRSDPKLAGIVSVPVANRKADNGKSLEVLIADKYRKYDNMHCEMSKKKVEEMDDLGEMKFAEMLKEKFGIGGIDGEKLACWKKAQFPEKAKNPDMWA